MHFIITLFPRFLIQSEGWGVEEAIAAVGKARGYPIERENYLAHLRNLDKPSSLFPKVVAAKDMKVEKENGDSSGLQIFDGVANDSGSDKREEVLPEKNSDKEAVHILSSDAFKGEKNSYKLENLPLEDTEGSSSQDETSLNPLKRVSTDSEPSFEAKRGAKIV